VQAMNDGKLTLRGVMVHVLDNDWTNQKDLDKVLDDPDVRGTEHVQDIDAILCRLRCEW